VPAGFAAATFLLVGAEAFPEYVDLSIRLKEHVNIFRGGMAASVILSVYFFIVTGITKKERAKSRFGSFPDFPN